MRVYGCDNCGYTSTKVEELLLMPDGETEYCDPCYKVLGNDTTVRIADGLCHE